MQHKVIDAKDVVIRFVQFDQIAFQDQRFQVRLAQQHVKIVNVRDHCRHLGGMRRIPEIAPHPVLQVDGFADVDDLTRGILHQITAWGIRQHPDLFLQFFSPVDHCLFPFPE